MESMFSSKRRNYMLESHRRDQFIEWMKEILNHGFVLDAPETYSDTFEFFEEMIEEHILNPTSSRLKSFVPTIGQFHTSLRLKDAWEIYDSKYAVSQRKHICPSFNELRHILNLSQVISIGQNLSLISFDGDQTLYSDGGNFENNMELAFLIICLLKARVKVAIITAAGYGYDGSKYSIRLQGLLDSFIAHELGFEETAQFYVYGGECNYLLQGSLQQDKTKILLVPVSSSILEAASIPSGLNPLEWSLVEISTILDTAEATIQSSIIDLRLRAKMIRKERAVGMFPGGDEAALTVPRGHGSKKLKREALDEVVLRVIETLRQLKPKPTIPFCVFNGGRDVWVDIGNKGVAVKVLQSLLRLPPDHCLHVGDQFLSAGNDIAAREMCPCIWITSPSETTKILEHVIKFKLGNTVAGNGTDVGHTRTKLLVLQLKEAYTPAKPYISKVRSSDEIISSINDVSTMIDQPPIKMLRLSPSVNAQSHSFNVYTG